MKEVINNTENIRLRAISGEVYSESKLVKFLYHLMRDELPVGKVEELARECSGAGTTFTNGFLASYAKDIATRLLE